MTTARVDIFEMLQGILDTVDNTEPSHGNSVAALRAQVQKLREAVTELQRIQEERSVLETLLEIELELGGM